ncbi:hypothetical protein [Nocardia carnea]|nr:hypothetical protein [Nocardia carnea]
MAPRWTRAVLLGGIAGAVLDSMLSQHVGTGRHHQPIGSIEPTLFDIT